MEKIIILIVFITFIISFWLGWANAWCYYDEMRLIKKKLNDEK